MTVHQSDKSSVTTTCVTFKQTSKSLLFLVEKQLLYVLQGMLSSAMSIHFIPIIPKLNILNIKIFLWGSPFQVSVFRYEGLGFVGIIGFYKISKPKINLKHTFNDSLRLIIINRTHISKILKFLNRKIKKPAIRIKKSKSR